MCGIPALQDSRQHLYNMLCVGLLLYKSSEKILSRRDKHIFRILTRELSAYSRWILKSERQFFLKVYTNYHMAGGMIKG